MHDTAPVKNLKLFVVCSKRSKLASSQSRRRSGFDYIYKVLKCV